MFKFISSERKLLITSLIQILIIISVIIIITIVGQVEALADTIYVPNDYSIIQAAVNAASPGDTIIVRDGTYTENVNIYKDHLTIRSENGADSTIVQAANPDNHVFKVTADYVNISGFTVKNTVYPSCGIYLNKANSCNIIGNSVSTINGRDGVSLEFSDSNVIANNRISENWCGVYLHESKSNILRNNSMANNYFVGIYLWYSSNNNLVTNNTFENCGLYVIGAYQNIVRDNIVNGSPLIYLEDLSNLKITNAGQVILLNCNNIVLENLNISNTSVGIELWKTSGCIISSNVLFNNANGVSFYHSDNNTITYNSILNNGHGGLQYLGWGIGLLAFSKNNKIYLNNLMDNGENVHSENSTNIWNSTEKIIYTHKGKTYTSYLGNYWSDYSGSDTNGDGISDTPYSIDGDQDSYPLMEPFKNYY